MSDTIPCSPGAVAWTDLTVPDAARVRDFYASVVGWTLPAVDMGGYGDDCMNLRGDGQTVAGICHARGVHADQSRQASPVGLTSPGAADSVWPVERSTRRSSG